MIVLMCQGFMYHVCLSYCIPICDTNCQWRRSGLFREKKRLKEFPFLSRLIALPDSSRIQTNILHSSNLIFILRLCLKIIYLVLKLIRRESTYSPCSLIWVLCPSWTCHSFWNTFWHIIRRYVNVSREFYFKWSYNSFLYINVLSCYEFYRIR